MLRKKSLGKLLVLTFLLVFSIMSCRSGPVIIYPDIAIPVMADDPIMPDMLFFKVDDNVVGLSGEDAEELGYYILDMKAQMKILRSYVTYFIRELEYIDSMREQ